MHDYFILNILIATTILSVLVYEIRQDFGWQSDRLFGRVLQVQVKVSGNFFGVRFESTPESSLAPEDGLLGLKGPLIYPCLANMESVGPIAHPGPNSPSWSRLVSIGFWEPDSDKLEEGLALDPTCSAWGTSPNRHQNSLMLAPVNSGN